MEFLGYRALPKHVGKMPRTLVCHAEANHRYFTTVMVERIMPIQQL
jgi:hypothetical protein